MLRIVSKNGRTTTESTPSVADGNGIEVAIFTYAKNGRLKVLSLGVYGYIPHFWEPKL